jgi:hypothetical protein
MLFGPEGCTELVFLALRLEFAGLLLCDEIFGIFNHSSNIRVYSDQLSFFIYMRPSLDQFLMHNVKPSRESSIPASRSSCSFFVQSGIVLLLRTMASGVVCSSLKVVHSFGVMNPNQLNGETLG